MTPPNLSNIPPRAPLDPGVEGDANRNPEVARVFISHSSRDREQAGRLHDWLRNHGFVEAFLDFDKHAGIAPGSDWERTLYREIAGSEAVILVLTANWFESKWCFAEFTQARALGKSFR